MRFRFIFDQPIMSPDNRASFVIIILISGSVVHTSVVRTQTKNIFTVNGRLYDPDLFSSLYEETSRRNRLYLGPELTKVKREVENDSFDIHLVDKTPKAPDHEDSQKFSKTREDLRRLAETREVSVEDDVNDLQRGEFLGLEDKDDENAMKELNELETKLQNDAIVSMASGAKRNSRRRRNRYFPSSFRPKVRRNMSKLAEGATRKSPWIQRKRYKAGVVDRIAHGFGKRSMGSIKVDDLILGILGDSEISTEADGDSRELTETPEYVHIANLVGIMDNYKEKHDIRNFISKPNSQILDDLIQEFTNTQGQEDEATDSGNDLL